jgi:hypothetical protein
LPPARVARAFLIEMEGLWIELGGEALDPLFVDHQPSGAEHLPDGKVLKVSLCHLMTS